ncbi:hypothetical protein NMG60_11033957 [Bertholletia excelsa]
MHGTIVLGMIWAFCFEPFRLTLVLHVFVFKFLGLKRTGKSCRLRWVNYLHPGLKRGKMTPQEERLVLELHAKWGNRWSRIARRLPGRTDNEIKNYWRTHMRKKAQEKRRAASPPSSFSSVSTGVPAAPLPAISGSSSSSSNNSVTETKERSFYDTGGLKEGEVYSMDDIWKDIGESDTIKPLNQEEISSFFSAQLMASPIWNYCSDSFWEMEEESKIFPITADNFFAGYDRAS